MRSHRTVFPTGTIQYRNDAGDLHRNGDLPAVEWNNGDKVWFVHGKCHRTDGPAIELSNGTKSWYLFDQGYITALWNEPIGYYKALYLYKGIIIY